MIEYWRDLEMGTHQIVYVLAAVFMIILLICARRKRLLPLWIIVYVFEGVFLLLTVDSVIYYNALPGWTLGEFMSALLASVVFIILIVLTLISHICSTCRKNAQESH